MSTTDRVIESQFPKSILQRIERCGVMAVVTIDDAAHAVPLGKALLACGIDVIEITFRSAAAVDAIRLLCEQVPEILVGAGTLLDVDQVRQAMQAGATFGVAPGLNANVVRQAQDLGLPFAPGVTTPSDIEAAIALGCRQLKFFPAEPIGGIRYLRTVVAPYEHLGIRFFVSGGVNADNASGYLYFESVTAIGGVWIAPRKLIQNQDWSTVIDNATEARQIVKEMRTR